MSEHRLKKKLGPTDEQNHYTFVGLTRAFVNTDLNAEAQEQVTSMVFSRILPLYKSLLHMPFFTRPA